MAPTTRQRVRRRGRRLDESFGESVEHGQQIPTNTTLVTEMAREFFTTLQNTIQQVSLLAPIPRRDSSMNEVVEQFRRLQPPRFKGIEGPAVVEEWVAEMERIFNHLELSEPQKVSCAQFQLAEDAAQWWESIERTMNIEERCAQTWDDFKKAISRRYFPPALCFQKELEFVNLCQGALSVMEYERQFNRLSRYATYLVDTSEKKARRFEKGLRPEVGGIISGLKLLNYHEVFDRALLVSISLGLEYDESQENQIKGKREISEEDKINGLVKISQLATCASVDQPKPKLCPNCRKSHWGKCMVGKNVCYRCHRPGHKHYECPKVNTKRLSRGNVKM